MWKGCLTPKESQRSRWEWLMWIIIFSVLLTSQLPAVLDWWKTLPCSTHHWDGPDNTTRPPSTQRLRHGDCSRSSQAAQQDLVSNRKENAPSNINNKAKPRVLLAVNSKNRLRKGYGGNCLGNFPGWALHRSCSHLLRSFRSPTPTFLLPSSLSSLSTLVMGSSDFPLCPCVIFQVLGL